MRLLFLNYEFPPVGGGGANANRYLFKEFSTIPDLSVDCITCVPGDRDIVESFSGNITLHRLNVRKKALHYWTQKEVLTWLFRAIPLSARMARENPYDLCHAFFGFPSGLPAWMLRDRMPYVVSLRGSDVPGFNPRFSLQYIPLKPLFRRIWAGAEYVVANSKGLKDLALQFTPYEDISVIPNGIDTREFSPPPWQGREPGHILCVSRMVERKGVHHLLAAFPKVLEKYPDARLTLVGEGNMLETLRAQASESGLSGRVAFSGYVSHEDLPPYYARAQVFVQPSFYEGMSNTVLEAMASGLPIVATGEGGKEELYRENACMAPYGDPDGLARVLIRLLGNPETLQGMSVVSRKIAQEFSWENVARRYLDLYCLLAEKRVG